MWKARYHKREAERNTLLWLEWTPLKCVECSISIFCVSCDCNSFSGLYLTKKTSINIRDPKLPEVGQLSDHHIWQLLHKLHLLRGFKAPGCNKDTHMLYHTNILIYAVKDDLASCTALCNSKNHRWKYLISGHTRLQLFVFCLYVYCTAWRRETLQLPYAWLLYTVISPKHCRWQKVSHTQTNKSTVRVRLRLGSPSQAPNVWVRCKMIAVLTAGSWCSQAAPSLQRRRVAEPAEGWRTGIPLWVQSSDTHWQT